ncbi:GNAT family N-acetyltransferase [Kribbella turkmenica]|uniref:GNAT family N-acetyltransferase n=1 Tax=Kribbella turkmenica TaxID=2530375 RepID=A0A4R4X5T6_9ACTN|nr:GNAT family N-acetyltransferase [Kribbella turkmenica]TDD25672.1 GNAT family N-acetyltransferase [Kribbella turkmenica]
MAIGIERFKGDWDELRELVDLAFSAPWSEAQLEAERRVWEPERSTVAVDEGQLVGHTGTFSLRMTVPGAQIPVAGVTLVAVRPTHRRRGILRELMRAQLTDVHEAGSEPIAALTASEAAIYGRFGYGLASDHQEIVVPKASRELRPVAGIDDVRIRYVDVHDTLASCAALRNRLAADRPGMFHHDDRWQAYVVADNVTSDPVSGSRRRCVVAERDGELTGFAYYRSKRADKGFIQVNRVHAVDLASHAALWRYLLEPDLLSETRCASLPSDDPLLELLLDPRAAGPITRDGLWVRPVDVGRALAARTYAREFDVVLAVTDEFLPWNAGGWHLAGGPAGATCEATSRPADLTVDVRELGAVYLGRPSLARLGAAGLVQEHTAGALAVASQAFSASRLPWLDTGF